MGKTDYFPSLTVSIASLSLFIAGISTSTWLRRPSDGTHKGIWDVDKDGNEIRTVRAFAILAIIFSVIGASVFLRKVSGNLGLIAEWVWDVKPEWETLPLAIAGMCGAISCIVYKSIMSDLVPDSEIGYSFILMAVGSGLSSILLRDWSSLFRLVLI